MVTSGGVPLGCLITGCAADVKNSPTSSAESNPPLPPLDNAPELCKYWSSKENGMLSCLLGEVEIPEKSCDEYSMHKGVDFDIQCLYACVYERAGRVCQFYGECGIS